MIRPNIETSRLQYQNALKDRCCDGSQRQQFGIVVGNMSSAIRRFVKSADRPSILIAFVTLLVMSGISSVYQHNRVLVTKMDDNYRNGNGLDDAPREENLLLPAVSQIVTEYVDTTSKQYKSPFLHFNYTSDKNSKETINMSSDYSEITAFGNNSSIEALQQWDSIISHNKEGLQKNQTSISMLQIPIESYGRALPIDGSPLPNNILKIYVYDLENTLPKSYASDVYDWYVHERPESHWVTDLPLVRLFRTHPGVVDDPSLADIFVVPYPHAGHCMSAHGYKLGCRQLDERIVKETIQSKLAFYNFSTACRHLFLLSDSDTIGHSWISSKPLVATYGPIWEHSSTKRKRPKYRSSMGHIVIPPFQGDLRFQPSFVEQEILREKKRDLSLVFVASDINKNMRKSPRIFRRYLLDELEQIRNKQEQQESSSFHANATTVARIGGLPFVASSNVGAFASHDLYDLYRRSVFCPIIAGDITWQRRFFDAMACGCLPVVVSYPLVNNDSFRDHTKQYRPNDTDSTLEQQQIMQPRSWFVPEDGPHSIGDTWSVQESYPFVDQIDYRSFVVECKGNTTHPKTTAKNIVQKLVSLLEEKPSLDSNGDTILTVLEQKQIALREASTSVIYGVGPDAHRTNDAFAHLLRSIRSYLDFCGNCGRGKRCKRCWGWK